MRIFLIAKLERQSQTLPHVDEVRLFCAWTALLSTNASKGFSIFLKITNSQIKNDSLILTYAAPVPDPGSEPSDWMSELSSPSAPQKTRSSPSGSAPNTIPCNSTARTTSTT